MMGGIMTENGMEGPVLNQILSQVTSDSQHIMRYFPPQLHTSCQPGANRNRSLSISLLSDVAFFLVSFFSFGILSLLVSAAIPHPDSRRVDDLTGREHPHKSARARLVCAVTVVAHSGC